MAQSISLFDAVGYLGADWKGLKRDMGKAHGVATKGWRDISSGMMAINKRIIAGFAVAGAAVGAVTIKIAKMGIDAVESENLFEVSMGAMAERAREWSVQLSKTLGLNQFEIRKTVGVFNVMFSAMGIGKEKAFEMATGLTELSLDMASFFNLRPEEAFAKLQSGIAGEIEPLRRLGVAIDVNSLQHLALTEGIGKTFAQMTQAEKVALRYKAIMEQTTLAQGDLLRTLDDGANIWRRFTATMSQTFTTIGMEMTPATDVVLGLLLDMAEGFQTFVAMNSDTLKKWVDVAATRFQEWRDKFDVWYDFVFEDRIEKINGKWVQSEARFVKWKETFIDGLEEIIVDVQILWEKWGGLVVGLGKAWFAISALNLILSPFILLLSGAWKMAAGLNIAIRALVATNLASWLWGVSAAFWAWNPPLLLLVAAGGILWHFKDWISEQVETYLPSLHAWLGRVTDRFIDLGNAIRNTTYGDVWDFAKGVFGGGAVWGGGGFREEFDFSGPSSFSANSVPSAQIAGPVTVNVTAPNALEAGHAVRQVLEATRRGQVNFGAQAVNP